ncbi:unnamed protein product [Prorocentrum cordatum]|uniref:Sacsin/Nov domain-containing protein n=1 Tax=Prorocentrum cordatum TaxID=2364126 RepID=A0ABN9VBC7_9DINO|nr:unnamed protein product [Polarella glacialis]
MLTLDEAPPPAQPPAERGVQAEAEQHTACEEEALNSEAVEDIDQLLSLACAGPPEWQSFSAAALGVAEHVGSLAAARARTKVMNAVAGAAAAECAQADVREVRARLAASEEGRRADVAALEQRVEGLEADLSSAQRQLEEAQARATAAERDVAEAAEARATVGPASSRAVATGGGPEAGASLAKRRVAGGVPHAPRTPQEFIAELRRERLVDLEEDADLPDEVRDGISRLSRSLCAAVERLAEDLYESECHFIYELVQNAEDAHRRSSRKAAEAELRLGLGAPGESWRNGYFVSDSNEEGFSQVDVRAVCDISASSKSRPSSGGNTIGCKGIGFKSVFTVSDRPHVLSRGFTFVFDVAGPLGKLGYVTPTWLAPEQIAALPEEVRLAHAAGRTVLFLPLKRPGLSAAIEREMEELSGPGRATLLFLRQLQRPAARVNSRVPDRHLEAARVYLVGSLWMPVEEEIIRPKGPTICKCVCTARQVGRSRGRSL